MYDKALVLSGLRNIEEALQYIIKETSCIASVNDFLLSDHGVLLLNTVYLKLLAVGETLKNIDKRTNHTLLAAYPSIPWKDVMGLRDVIAHHYFELDPDIIFKTLRNDIPPLLEVIQEMKISLLNK